AAEGDPLRLFRAHCGVAGRGRALSRFRGSPVLLEQVRHALGGLCALSDPVIDAAEVDAQPLFATLCDGIEEADAFDVLTAAGATAVRHDDVIKRTLDRAATCQPNDYHKRETLSS